jgi:hypothetical protein
MGTVEGRRCPPRLLPCERSHRGRSCPSRLYIAVRRSSYAEDVLSPVNLRHPLLVELLLVGLCFVDPGLRLVLR